MTDDTIETSWASGLLIESGLLLDPGPSGFDFGEGSDFDQIRVERLVSDLRNNIAELATIRLCPDTAQLLLAEEVSLGSALTALQMLLSHVTAGRPMLRVVK